LTHLPPFWLTKKIFHNEKFDEALVTERAKQQAEEILFHAFIQLMAFTSQSECNKL